MGMKFSGLARLSSMGLRISCCATLSLLGAAALGQEPSAPAAPAQEAPAPAAQEPVATPQDELVPQEELAPPSDDTVISEAQEHFRMGVSLYRQGNFREALDEFNRALALDADYAEAKKFRDDAQTQINVAATGVNPAERPAFESFDPQALGQPDESAQLSPEEYKIQRVRELVEQAESYLEYQFYKEAVDYFEQVLLIAPDNKRAQKGLQAATLGRYDESIKDSQGRVKAQFGNVRTEIERMKLLPDGADAKGIRNPRIEVPRVEERLAEDKVPTQIEKVLDSPINIEFEEVHLSEILDFVNEFYDVNIVVDNRVSLSADQAKALRAGSTPGQPAAAPAAGGRPQPQRRQQGGGGLNAGFGGAIGAGGAAGGNQRNQQLPPGTVTDGMVQFIRLKNVPLRDALKSILHPLNLDFVVQKDLIWISTSEKIRTEAFEDLETRVYILANAGVETEFKLLLSNNGGQGQRQVLGGQQSGQGGQQGGQQGGGQSGGGVSGGGGGGVTGGGGQGGGQTGGGQSGGGQGGGQNGGGQGRNSGGFTNISELFDSIGDAEVGEYPNPFGSQGGGRGSGGLGGTVGGGAAGARGGFSGGAQGGQGGQAGGGSNFIGGPGPGLGAAEGFTGESTSLQIIRSLVPPVIEPVTQRLLSFMRYNLLTNQLVAYTTPKNHARIKELVEQFDIEPAQVSIESKFVNLKVGDIDKKGFTWDGTWSSLEHVPDPTLFEDDANDDGFPDNVDPNTGAPKSPFDFVRSVIDLAGLGLSPGPPGAALGFNIIDNGNGDNLSVTFDFLSQLAETELLSAPRVTTMNQKPAVIADITTEFFKVGEITQVIAIQGNQGTTSNSSTSSFKSPILESFIFGYTLSVTPYIADNKVRLWLNPQVIEKLGEKTFEVDNTINGNPQKTILTFPTVGTQSAWTNVNVSDGDTLVLGGLITDRSIKEERRVPYLSKIPVLGFFFRGKSKQVSQSSLLIFVTPTIIDSSGSRSFSPTE